MEQADKKQRSFVNRYWVLIVIVLWLIAWSARDVLSPGVETVQDDAETETVAEAEPKREDVEAEAAAEADAVREAAEAEAAAEAAREAAEAEAAAKAEAAREDEEAEAAAEAEAVREDADTEAVAMTEEAAPESAPAEGRPTEDDADATAIEDDEREEAVEAQERTPDRAAAESASEEQIARQVQEALEAGRAAYWNAGPGAAAVVLRDALTDIPETSQQRAALYGELGNALYASGDAHGAMRAWDRALGMLPANERRMLMQRLAPLYDRHHRDGVRHLRQYR
ncbi:hypothetical protein [Thioalkalivibrio sp. ALJT]|uniref:hypothetical protein n=1 Tax=Thioalkalivibrio sp. ALJT TaxID=1158146 RepID=UPI0003735F36|nr:hypothetical protein [Thioalkalivibrio sp. ALJT]